MEAERKAAKIPRFGGAIRCQSVVVIAWMGIFSASTQAGIGMKGDPNPHCTLYFSKVYSLEQRLSRFQFENPLRDELTRKFSSGNSAIEPEKIGFELQQKNVSMAFGTGTVLEHRIANHPPLRQLFTEFGWFNAAGRLEAVDGADAVLDFAREMILRARKQLPFPNRRDYALPGLFTINLRRGNDLYVGRWHFSKSIAQEGVHYAKFMAKGQISFTAWAEIINRFGVIPVSLDDLFFHDFAHMMAAYVHPFEELVLQRRFYRQFLAELEKLPEEARPIYSKRMQAVANILFEGFELPKIEAWDMFTRFSAKRARSRAEPAQLLARILPKERGQLLSLHAFDVLSADETAALLAHFRDFVGDDARFYAAFDGYGGDFYDVINHYSSGARNYAYSGHGWLEQMRAIALADRVDADEVAKRLMVAFYNAKTMELTFQKFLEAAFSGAVKDGDGRVIPWMGTLVETYFDSYAHPDFWRQGVAKDLGAL